MQYAVKCVGERYRIIKNPTRPIKNIVQLDLVRKCINAKRKTTERPRITQWFIS